MFVVVVGARARAEEMDKQLVNDLLFALRRKYPALVIISAACDRGVGEMIKDICLKNRDKFRFVEIATKIYAGDIPRAKLSQVFLARNACVAELGDEYHILVTRERRGAVENLVERVAPTGRPVFIYEPGKGAELLVNEGSAPMAPPV